VFAQSVGWLDGWCVNVLCYNIIERVCIVPNCCTNKNQNELFSTHGAVIIGSKKIRSAD
jgi:hypothetical protein